MFTFMFDKSKAAMLIGVGLYSSLDSFGAEEFDFSAQHLFSLIPPPAPPSRHAC